MSFFKRYVLQFEGEVCYLLINGERGGREKEGGGVTEGGSKGRRRESMSMTAGAR